MCLALPFVCLEFYLSLLQRIELALLNTEIGFGRVHAFAKSSQLTFDTVQGQQIFDERHESLRLRLMDE